MAESASPAGEVTRLLHAWKEGDRQALEELIPLVYNDLHRMARRHLGRERPGHTLQPSAIVNEVYLRLAGNDGGARGDWQNRAHFFGAAARSMRRILVDHARAKTAKKRGALDAEQARVVELRFFTGLTEEETAEALGISVRTVHRKWLSAKAYLHRELAGGSS